MEITPESIRDQIPYYLTQEQKKGIAKALREFPRDTQYYLTGLYQNCLLQGDGWRKLQIFNFQTGEKASISGIILSNTCDVAPENERDLPINIVFAPIIPLSAYSASLTQRGIESDRIREKIAAIKEQRITTLFYLPAGGSLHTDHIALLDDIHTMPAKAFETEAGNGKVFTLSQIDTCLPNVEQNDSNKFYFMCKFNKLQAPVYSLPLEGGGLGWGSSVASF